MSARILYVTDLAYSAAGRRYGDEDVYLTSRLRESFGLALCHPLDAAALMSDFDAVVVRNSGPVIHYRAAFDEFRRRAAGTRTKVYNPLTGRGDMAGKQYLVDLTAAGYPVIPTVDRREDLHLLPEVDGYVAKPKLGADSIGLSYLDPGELGEVTFGETLVQPRIDFLYELSFYFVDAEFQYALHAPDTARRWELAPYTPSSDDLAFAAGFVEWNTLDHGIQRIDACRDRDGRLLLVEVEDLNPYLSLDLVGDEVRQAFVRAMTGSIQRYLAV